MTVPFRGCRDGDPYPTSFKNGDSIEGELAAAMVAAGYAEEIKRSALKTDVQKEEKAEKKPPRNKAKTPPRNKSGS